MGVDLGQEGYVGLVAGALRLRVSLDARILEVASEPFGSSIVQAVSVEGGWVFVAEDGTVARSDSFLGVLRVLGRVPTPFVWPRVYSRGRAAVVDRSGTAWTTDGTTAPLPLAHSQPFFMVTFDSRALGAAVMSDGGIRRTQDGGAHWERAPTEGGRVRVVERSSVPSDPFRFLSFGRVSGVEEWLRATTGNVVGTLRGAELWLRATTADASGVQLANSMRHSEWRFRLFETVPFYPEQCGAWAGSTLLCQPHLTERPVIVSSHAPRTQTRLELPDFRALRGQCELSGVASAAILACPYDPGGSLVYLGQGARVLSREDLPRSPMGVRRLHGADGREWISEGPCEETQPSAAGTQAAAPAFCLHDARSGTVRTIRVPEPALAARWPFALCGSSILYARDEAPTARPPRHTWRLFDAHSERLSDPFPGYAVEWIAVTPDCTLVATLAPTAHQFVLRTTDGALQARALPAGARDAAFRSARSGMAVGEHVADTFSTEDGGATWQPVETGHTGIPHDFAYRQFDLGVVDPYAPLQHQSHGYGRVVCRTPFCRAGWLNFYPPGADVPSPHGRAVVALGSTAYVWRTPQVDADAVGDLYGCLNNW